MARISDEPVPHETLSSIRGCAVDALGLLGRKFASADPATVIKAIDTFAYRWQKGLRPSSDVISDLEEARLLFGSLWGEQLVKQFGWEWVQVNFHDGSFAYGVVSRDRSLATFPLEFMLGCLQDPGVDVTVELAFNLLLSGEVPRMPRRSYTNVMEGVRRVVPRD
jgi:hypothetical protein